VESHGMGFEPKTTLAADERFAEAHLERVRRLA
jgi:hypothetical protein